MKVQITEDLDRISWDDLARVIELAPLGKRDPQELRIAFQNSTVRCFAYDGDRLVGAGRALSDGVWRAAIYDVVVLPEYQGQGIGTRILRHLIQSAHAEVIMLFTAPGKEDFYRRLGFRKMKTALAIMPDPDLRRDKGYLE